MDKSHYPPFASLAYLKAGTPRQQEAYQAIAGSGVFRLLAAYTPVLAGTIPIDIDIETSDLDIICEVHDAKRFAATLTAGLSSHQGFTMHEEIVQGLPVVICRFTYMDFAFEVFGQPLPVSKQNAYLHMLAEYSLLQAAGPSGKEAIRALKRQGLKTEPAFARYFGISGDPYEALLKLGKHIVHEGGI
ncbi:MAG: DUF4269 domain-containing protein [Bacillota bacterium]